MQFSSSILAIAALSIGSAFAQTDGNVAVHVVTVGNMNGSLTFTPNTLTAAAGSMVQFQFAPKNHSVVQSTFDAPCSPISASTATVGIFSGYMPVAADAQSIPTYTIMINDTKPIWLYCSQGKHCESGMSMVINENTAANSSRSLANYQLAAKSVSASGAPSTGVSNGTDGTIPASSTGSGSDSGSGSSSSSATTSASGTKSTGAAAAVRVSQAMGLGAMVAAAMALL